MIKAILDLVAKTGMDKGDASSSVTLGGAGLVAVFMLFVSSHQYERDQDRDLADRGKLWHEIHVLQAALISHNIAIPADDLATNQQPTTKDNP